MGLGSLSAELTRSVGVDPSTRRGLQSDDRSASRFDDYLAEARSAHQPARTEEPDPSDEPDRLADEAADEAGDEPKKPDSEASATEVVADAPPSKPATVVGAGVTIPQSPAGDSVPPSGTSPAAGPQTECGTGASTSLPAQGDQTSSSTANQTGLSSAATAVM